MEVPENYAYYCNKKNRIPYKDWPQECKDYKNWQRRNRMNPKWAHLTAEERRAARAKVSAQNRQVWYDKYNSMTDEEKRAINKKKGNHYNNLSEAEKLIRNEELRKRSQNFWDGMSEEERKIFGQSRWDLKTDEEKQVIVKRFNQAGVERMKNLPREEIDRQISVMNAARLQKLKDDPEFRQIQIEMLRQHNEEFFEKMTDEDWEAFNENRVVKIREYWTNRWNTDEDFRNKQTEFLKSISPLGAQAIKLKWETDDVFREEQIQHLSNMRAKFLEEIDPSEKYRLLSHNRLNDRFESMFSESILNSSFYFVPELLIRVGKSHKHWDYGIYDRSTRQLVMLVDVDGRFYHADTADYNGIQSKEEVDEKRGIIAPTGVKIQIIDENRFNEGFHEMIQNLQINYDEYTNQLFELYRSMEFPFPKYHHDELRRSYIQLCDMSPDNKYLNMRTRNREGDRLISHFHRSIYRANVNGKKSPYDAWYDDRLLMKCINNRILYRTSLNPNKIVQGFNISKIAPKVSVFSAGRAKIIISRYLNEFDTIFDPFSGFSGRMLAVMSTGKAYVGQDISSIHISESMQLVEFLTRIQEVIPSFIRPTLTCQDVMESSGEYPCLFTCPPYADKEVWYKTKSMNKSCDEWITECLRRFTCKRYVFVVDTSELYSEYVVDRIENRSHFGVNYEYIIVIDR